MRVEFFHQLFWQEPERARKKRRHIKKKNVLFHQVTASCHNLMKKVVKIQELHFQLFPTHHIRQIWPPPTFTCLQNSEKCSHRNLREMLELYSSWRKVGFNSKQLELSSFNFLHVVENIEIVECYMYLYIFLVTTYWLLLLGPQKYHDQLKSLVGFPSSKKYDVSTLLKREKKVALSSVQWILPNEN